MVIKMDNQKVMFFNIRKGFALRQSIKRKKLEAQEIELKVRIEKAKYELKVIDLTSTKISYEQKKHESKYNKENDIQDRKQ